MRARKEHRKIPRHYVLLGEYLKELRLKAGLTQREVSIALGYSTAQFISNWECGIAMPPLHRMKLLLELYRAKPQKFIELALAGEATYLEFALQKRGKSEAS